MGFLLIFMYISIGYTFTLKPMSRIKSFKSLLASNANVDLFGADSLSLKLDGIEKNHTSDATKIVMTEYIREMDNKTRTSIVSSITGNRTMKAEALRLEAELDQIKFNEDKLSKKMERLALIDRCIKDLVEEKMSLNELFTNPEYKFDDQFVLRIAELATMAKTREEQALFRGYMEEILKSKECADVTKRILQKITQGPGNNS